MLCHARTLRLKRGSHNKTKLSKYGRNLNFVRYTKSTNYHIQNPKFESYYKPTRFEYHDWVHISKHSPTILITKRYYSTKIDSKVITIKDDNLTKLNKSEKNSIVIDDLTPLQHYCKLVGATTGKFLGLTALTGGVTVGAFMTLSSAIPFTAAPYVYAGGLLCSFIGSLYHAYHIDSTKSDEERLRHAYWMHALVGIVLAPSLIMFSAFIPHALITTAALVAGPITFSKFMPKGSLLPWGPALYTALWGLIGVGCASLISPLLGMHGLAMTLHGIDLYAGVALFTIYNAYDTHKLINDFENGKKDHIGHAANYSLNAINIFVRLLEIYTKTKNQKI